MNTALKFIKLCFVCKILSSLLFTYFLIYFFFYYFHRRLLSLSSDEMEVFSTLQALCAGNVQISGGFPHKGLVMQSFCMFPDVNLNKLLNKLSSCQ